MQLPNELKTKLEKIYDWSVKHDDDLLLFGSFFIGLALVWWSL